jgi:phage FluMu protein Com
VVIEKLAKSNERIVRQSIYCKSSSVGSFTEQRCLVCDKKLLEIRPYKDTVIRIKCKGCLVINEITYSIN